MVVMATRYKQEESKMRELSYEEEIKSFVAEVNKRAKESESVSGAIESALRGVGIPDPEFVLSSSGSYTDDISGFTEEERVEAAAAVFVYDVLAELAKRLEEV